MTATTDIRDCARLATAITACGGAVPDALGHLLAAHTLLSSPAAAQAPETDILTHALDGSLTAKKLAELAPAAATADLVNGYLRRLAGSSAHTLVGQWHRELKAGAADQILDSLRKNFDKHAEAIAHARTLINPESTAEAVIESGQPELVTAWQTLDGHLKVIAKIAAVASQFGCRLAQFPQIVEYSLAENACVDDRALMCCEGSLIADSWLFGRPDPAGHRSSPFFKTALKLHTIAEAQSRYDEFAAIEFDKVHSGPRGGFIGQDGQMYEDPRPENPFRQKVTP